MFFLFYSVSRIKGMLRFHFYPLQTGSGHVRFRRVIFLIKFQDIEREENYG